MGADTKQRIEYILEELASRTDLTKPEGKRYYEALAAVIRAPYREHHASCEDAWFSCPKSGDYAREGLAAEKECNCGKDEYDTAINELCRAMIVTSASRSITVFQGE